MSTTPHQKQKPTDKQIALSVAMASGFANALGQLSLASEQISERDLVVSVASFAATTARQFGDPSSYSGQLLSAPTSPEFHQKIMEAMVEFFNSDLAAADTEV